MTVNLPVPPCPLLADETFQSCLQMTQVGTEMNLNYLNWTKMVLDELSWGSNPEKKVNGYHAKSYFSSRVLQFLVWANLKSETSDYDKKKHRMFS